MKRCYSLVATVLSLVLVSAGLSACSRSSAEHVSIGTASTGGTFFPLGTGMAKVASQYADGIQANAESTGGSVENVKLIQDGETEFALSDMGVAYEAVQDGSKDIRGIAVGYSQPLHILVKKDSPIQTVADLKDKRVAIGPSGSGTANMSKRLFKILGIWDSIDAKYLTHEQESQELADGRVDAATYVVGLPASAVDSFMNTHDGRLISLNADEVSKVHGKYPYLAGTAIPASSYPGQNEKVTTIGVSVGLIASSKVDKETVYQVTKAILGHSKKLKKYHPTGTSFDLEGSLEGMEIPVHKGATKYYKEVNYKRP